MDKILKCVVFITLLTLVKCATYGPLPDIPFHIIWQIPSGHDCPRADINISFVDILEDSGMIFNEGDHFEGEVSTILYRSVYGAWPHYLDGHEPPLNDGLPQLGNLTHHLVRARNAIENAIPEENFHGIACINMEQFRPLWERNWGDKTVYKTKSIKLIEKQFADLSHDKTWVEKEAQRVFDYHAKKYMMESLRLSTQMRPYGKWGYYHFPYCFNGGDNPTIHCRDTVKYGNDKMYWLWEESTAIFPSIYVFRETWSFYETAKYMYANIEEGIRVGDLVGGRDVYVYHKTMWNMTLPVQFYPKIIMFMGMRLSADFGVEGVILWGSQGHYRTKFDCDRGHEFARAAIIPYARSLLEFTKVCAETRCSSHGRCVHRGALDDQYADEILRDTYESLNDWTIDDKYKCRCKKGHSGEDCSLSGVSSASGVTFSAFLLVISLVFIGSR